VRTSWESTFVEVEGDIRSARHFLEILDELNYLNVEFVSFREQIDTGGPLGRAMIVIVGAIAELEKKSDRREGPRWNETGEVGRAANWACSLDYRSTRFCARSHLGNVAKRKSQGNIEYSGRLCAD